MLLTGGGASLAGAAEHLSRRLRLQAQLALPPNGSAINEPGVMLALGLAQYTASAAAAGKAVAA